jgi:hypothetical protein
MILNMSFDNAKNKLTYTLKIIVREILLRNDCQNKPVLK